MPTFGSTWFLDNQGYPNLFGGAAAVPFSWAPEWTGFSGNFFPVVHPGHPDPRCELVDGQFGCSNGTWGFTLKVGPSRLLTCGF